MKKGAALILVMIMVLASLVLAIRTLLRGNWHGELPVAEAAEATLAENMPGKQTLSTVMNGIRFATGVRSFDGVYIGSDGSLLTNMEEPSSRELSSTKNMLSSFAEKAGNAYLCLIPTSTVIRQQEVGDFVAESFYNQRRFINDTYADFTEGAGTVDVYPTLFSHRGEYIYYHTQKGPTSLGGYYIYREICSRLGITPKNMDSFNAAFKGYGYYGNLCGDEIRRYAKSDFVTLYSCTDGGNMTVTRYYGDGEAETQEGLYMYDEAAFEDKTDMIFGGLAPVTRITSGNSGGNLLVFCDETGKSWLPFIAQHYRTVTAVDLNEAPEKLLAGINTSSFQQVLFVYSADSFSGGNDFTKLEYVKVG